MKGDFWRMLERVERRERQKAAAKRIVGWFLLLACSAAVVKLVWRLL